MKSNRAFVRNPGNDYLQPCFFCRCDVRVPCKEGICKTWTGTLSNSEEPDQTPQNAASDQGLHCLLKLQENKDNWNSLESMFRTIFQAYIQRQWTLQCCQCFDSTSFSICSLFLAIIYMTKICINVINNQISSDFSYSYGKVQKSWFTEL